MRSTINIKGRLIDLDKPHVMGILNMTDDSFFDGGMYNDPGAAIQRVQEMMDQGATFIDIGGASSRPGAVEIDTAEELNRVVPIIREVKKMVPEAIISVDTYRSEVAVKAVEAGADIVNDISAGELDDNMFQVVRDLKVPYIAMHMQGTPQNMQNDPHYKDVVTDVMDYFLRKKEIWDNLGIKDVIIDPGFGFGKTVDHNFQLLSALPYLRETGYPVLAGVSRKSMINKVIGTRPETALNGTTAVHAIALMRGATILRVHDVKEAVETCKLYQVYKENDISRESNF